MLQKKDVYGKIDILRKYFITEGLHPSDERYESHNFQYYSQDIITRGNICMWWGNSMWPRFGVGWPKYTPHTQSLAPPPEGQPLQARPVAVEPINQTKKHLTELSNDRRKKIRMEYVRRGLFRINKKTQRNLLFSIKIILILIFYEFKSNTCLGVHNSISHPFCLSRTYLYLFGGVSIVSA